MLIVAAMLLAQTTAQPVSEAARSAQVDAAFAEISNSNPAKAITILDSVIADVEAETARRSGRTYCGMSMAETIAYMGMSAKEKDGAVAIGPAYCTALFLKGYSLVDLNRVPEARAMLERAISFAPMHAHFIVELAQTYRADRNWPKMLELCRSAVGYADLANDTVKVADKGQALRCIGYALIEQGKLDEAEAQYRECLKLDPKDAKAKNELQYIAEQRAKKN